MPNDVYRHASKELAKKRKDLAPQIHDAFSTFSERVFADGALPAKTKQLIAVAVAHVTQCPYCIRGDTKAALRHGAAPKEIMEAIWVAAEMRAGGAYPHAALALDTIDEVMDKKGRDPCRVVLTARRRPGDPTLRIVNQVTVTVEGDRS